MVLFRVLTLLFCILPGPHVGAVPDAKSKPDTPQFVLINDYLFPDESALNGAVKGGSWQQTKDDNSSYWSSGTQDAGKLNATLLTYIYYVYPAETSNQGKLAPSLSARDEDNKDKKKLGYLGILGLIPFGFGAWYMYKNEWFILPKDASLTQVNVGSCGGCIGGKPGPITQPGQLAEIIPHGTPVTFENLPNPPEKPVRLPDLPAQAPPPHVAEAAPPHGPEAAPPPAPEAPPQIPKDPPQIPEPPPEIKLKDPLPELKPPPSVGSPPDGPPPPPPPPPPSDGQGTRPPDPVNDQASEKESRKGCFGPEGKGQEGSGSCEARRSREDATGIKSG